MKTNVYFGIARSTHFLCKATQSFVTRTTAYAVKMLTSNTGEQTLEIIF